MSKIVYLLFFLTYLDAPCCTINELEQNAGIASTNKKHIIKPANARKVYCAPTDEQNNLSSISDAYPELEFQSLHGPVQYTKVKDSFDLVRSKYLVQRLRGAIYLRNKLRQTNPIPLDWTIADFSLNSNHSFIKSWAIKKLKEITRSDYQSYQYKSLFSLWDTQDYTLQQNVIEQIIVFQNNPKITITHDKNQFESTLRNLLFSCYFIIHHSGHSADLMKLTEKSHSILKSLIKRFSFPTVFSEKINDFDLLEEIKSEDGDLCIATIYTHILYLYHYNNNILHSSFIQVDKKKHLLDDIQMLFNSLHKSGNTSKKRFNDFYQLYFTFFKKLNSRRLES